MSQCSSIERSIIKLRTESALLGGVNMGQGELIHYRNLKTALKNKKLIVFQYSCSDLNKPFVNITSTFAIDFFTDDEWCALANETNFNEKIIRFVRTHKDYFFAFWNFNIKYGFKRFNNLGLDETEASDLYKRCIDLDAAFQHYGETTQTGYFIKEKNGIDSRYYLALLNELPFQKSYWIWGKHEAGLKNYGLLEDSSRAKAHVMCDLINLIPDVSSITGKSLNVSENAKMKKKAKEIQSIKAWFVLFLKTYKEKIKIALVFIAGIIVKEVLTFLWKMLAKA